MTIRSLSTLSTLCALTLVAGSAASALAAPPNDLCANAQLVTVAALNTPVTVTGTNVGATSDLTESSCSFGDDLDVWYTLTATITADYTFDTFDSLLGDTTLSVYSDCNFTELACNDDEPSGNTLWSQVVVHLVVGESVRIRVAGYDDGSGAFNLNAVATLPPTNDTCATAETISLNQTKTGDTRGANTDVVLDDTACGTFIGSGGAKDVFYSFTPTFSGSYKVSLCGSGFDTVLAVLSDCTGSPASTLACDDDSTTCTPGSRSEIAAVTLSAGVAYLIRVAGYDNGVGGDFGAYSLIITSNTAPPTGVCCRGATCNTSITQASCTATGLAGAAFVSAAATCNASGSTTTPCCYADYNKVNSISVQDIFDYLTDWFAGSPLANTGGNGSSGTLSTQAIFDFLAAWFSGGC